MDNVGTLTKTPLFKGDLGGCSSRVRPGRGNQKAFHLISIYKRLEGQLQNLWPASKNQGSYIFSKSFQKHR